MSGDSPALVMGQNQRAVGGTLVGHNFGFKLRVLAGRKHNDVATQSSDFSLLDML